MEGDDEVWLGTIQSRFDWGQSEGTHLRRSTDENEQVRYVRLGSVPKAGEAGRVPRAAYATGDPIVVRYAELGGLTRLSPTSSPGVKEDNSAHLEGLEDVQTSTAPSGTQPTRVSLTSVLTHPVDLVKAGGKPVILPKTYKKKRPVIADLGRKGIPLKKPKTEDDNDRPKRKPTAIEQAKVSKPLPAVAAVKAAGVIVDLATSSPSSDDDEENC